MEKLLKLISPSRRLFMKITKRDLNKYYEKEYTYETQNDTKNFLTRILLRNRLKFAERAKGKVLDIGCNDGTIAIRIKNKVDDIVGIDVSKKLVDIVVSRGIKAFVADAEDLSVLYRQKFDTVIIFETLEHLFNPSKCLAEIKKVLKENGRLLLTVPSVYGFIAQMLELKAKIEGKDAPIHHLYTKQKINEFLAENGFKVLSSSYNSFFNSIAVEAVLFGSTSRIFTNKEK